MTWKRLAHQEITSTGDNFSEFTFDSADILKVVMYVVKQGTGDLTLYPNAVTSGSNFSATYTKNGGAYSGNNNHCGIHGNYGQLAGNTLATYHINNLKTSEKLVQWNYCIDTGSASTNIPDRFEAVGKYTDTSNQITSFSATLGAGGFGAGSYITVWGDASDVSTDEKQTLADATRTESATVTFSDDFSSDNWTDRGSNVGVSGGAITWSSCAMGADNGTSKSITALSDTKWVMRFKFTPTAMNIPNQWIMWAVDTVGNPDSTAQDGIGVVLHDSYKLRLGTKTDSSAYYNQGASGDTMSSTLSNNTTYYIELARTSATNARLKYFSDSTYETQIDSTINVTITSSISGLDNLSTGVQSGGSSIRTMSATLDDLKIYNGVSDVDTTVSTAPNAGTQYRETDTRKIYRFSSLKTGCKAYYKFDSTSGGLTNQATSANGFADGLGSNVDGTVTGATTSTDKKLGTNSYLFDGNDYVVCGSTSDFNFVHKTGHTVTVAFWFKQSNAPSGGELIIGTASTSTTNSTGFYIGSHTSGRIFFALYDGDSTTAPLDDYLTGNNIIPDTSNWYHYVFTFDDSNLTIYRNGSQVATTSYTASSTTTGNATNSLTLGKAPHTSANYLDGRLDDMGIWDRVLSTSEISELYNSGTGKTVDTALVWKERGSA